MALACGNKLYELFEAIVMTVKSLVSIVQGSAAPEIRQEVAELNDPDSISLLLVVMVSFDPALVWKLGVTVKEIELSEFCIQSILSG